VRRKLSLAMVLALALPDLDLQSRALSITIEVANIAVGGGSVYVALFSSAAQYRKGEAFRGRILAASGSTLSFMETVPPGAYLLAAFQDKNGNGKLDKNLFGIPQEPFAIGSYGGRGIPPGFDALKAEVSTDGTLLRVSLLEI
jgi:uncharacterized protein (DUF2141 family)